MLACKALFNHSQGWNPSRLTNMIIPGGDLGGDYCKHRGKTRCMSLLLRRSFLLQPSVLLREHLTVFSVSLLPSRWPHSTPPAGHLPGPAVPGEVRWAPGEGRTTHRMHEDKEQWFCPGASYFWTTPVPLKEKILHFSGTINTLTPGQYSLTL